MSVGSVGLVLYVSRCRAVRCELSASELSTNRYIRILDYPIDLSQVSFHESHITVDVSQVSLHESHITLDLSQVSFHERHITLDLSQVDLLQVTVVKNQFPRKPYNT